MGCRGICRDRDDADALGAGLSFDEYMQVRRALGVCDHGRYLRYGGALFHGLGGTNRGSKHFRAFGAGASVGSSRVLGSH